MNHEEKLIRSAAVVFEFLRKIGEDKSCVFGSALLMRVLHLLGYPEAYTLTIRAEIENPALLRWNADHGEPVTDADFAARNRAGACIIHVGKSEANVEREGWWAGHLSVVVPHAYGEKHMLLDLTLVQANREEEGVMLQPACLDVSQTFVTGEGYFQAIMNGCRITYNAFPADRSYEDFSEWTCNSMDESAEFLARGISDRL